MRDGVAPAFPRLVEGLQNPEDLHAVAPGLGQVAGQVVDRGHPPQLVEEDCQRASREAGVAAGELGAHDFLHQPDHQRGEERLLLGWDAEVERPAAVEELLDGERLLLSEPAGGCVVEDPQDVRGG